MTVIVTLPGAPTLFGPAAITHPDGVSYRETKKRKLLVFDESGHEVGRYTPGSWGRVRIERTETKS